jgi:hypothetical protein
MNVTENSSESKAKGIDVVLGAQVLHPSAVCSNSGLTCLCRQWGDEGKGKLVDILSKDYDICARVGGGSNAGHTIVVNVRS